MENKQQGQMDMHGQLTFPKEMTPGEHMEPKVSYYKELNLQTEGTYYVSSTLIKIHQNIDIGWNNP